MFWAIYFLVGLFVAFIFAVVTRPQGEDIPLLSMVIFLWPIGLILGICIGVSFGINWLANKFVKAVDKLLEKADD